MALFGGLSKQKKEKEQKFCYRCGKEASGIFSSVKLKDESIMCMECLPLLTPLMKEEGVMDKQLKRRIGASDLTREEMDRLIEYRGSDAKRRSEFVCSESFCGGKLLLDREHMWFKLKRFEEVFFVQQIKRLGVVIVPDSGRYKVGFMMMMQNRYYVSLHVEDVFKPRAFLRINQLNELQEYIRSFHKKFCPNADLIISD